ncbi:MAG TPA: DUF1552 domain-containing protein [Opitutaceae bacterium]|jgi:hypothetical protein|nr:DUF1552 domain-containing protein [Opitutaceae bacterium]
MKFLPKTPLERRAAAMSRRHFLRGMGACVALPAFSSLLTRKMSAAELADAQLATTPTGAPLRTAFVFFPNGASPASWWPAGGALSPADFAFGPTLSPLEPLRKHVQVLHGLAQYNAIGGADGGGDHARGNGVFLTSVRLNKSATDIRAGISIDQVIADHVGHLTRFPSVELCCDATRKSADCDAGYSCAYQYNLSWRSANTPMPAESNPRLAFERLFGPGAHGERTRNAERRMAARKSILDYVMGDAKFMQQQLGRRDQDKLDQYLTGIREVEKRIQQSERFGPSVDPDSPTPAGIPARESEYVTLMYDILLLAFQTDSTRVATFVLGHDGDNRSFSEIGISEGHHDLSHHQNIPERVAKVAQIDRWYVEQFARFLARMDQIKDVDGNTLLHNSRILYGSGNADGNHHTHVDLPILLAGGGGGGLTGGRYLRYGERPLANLFVHLANTAGVQSLTRFGDSTGRLSNV